MKYITLRPSCKRHGDQLIKYIATIKSENANYSGPGSPSLSVECEKRRSERDGARAGRAVA